MPYTLQAGMTMRPTIDSLSLTLGVQPRTVIQSVTFDSVTLVNLRPAQLECISRAENFHYNTWILSSSSPRSVPGYTNEESIFHCLLAV